MNLFTLFLYISKIVIIYCNGLPLEILKSRDLPITKEPSPPEKPFSPYFKDGTNFQLSSYDYNSDFSDDIGNLTPTYTDGESEYYYSNSSYPVYFDDESATCVSNKICKGSLGSQYVESEPQYFGYLESEDLHLVNLNKGYEDCRVEAECYLQDSIPNSLTINTEILYLRQAVFKTINIGDLSVIPQLTVLRIDYSDLETIVPGAFQSQASLKTLQMEGNEISFMSSGMFLGLSSLEVLDLTNNHISSLTRESFEGLNSLLKLTLSMNDIVAINNCTFQLLPDLESLNLQSNSINYIHLKAFAGLDNLKTLQLDYNNIHIFPTQSLKLLRKLSTLQLSGNPIKRLERNSLRGIKRLKKLFLDFCFISYIDAKAFKNKRLEVLMINQNKLKNLPNFGLMTSLERIDLSDNPWRCDCDLIPTKLFLLRNNFAPPIPELKCDSPSNLRGSQAMMLTASQLCPSPGNQNTIKENKLPQSTHYNERIVSTDNMKTIQTVSAYTPTEEYPYYSQYETYTHILSSEVVPTHGGWVYDEITPTDAEIPLLPSEKWTSANPTSTASLPKKEQHSTPITTEVHNLTTFPQIHRFTTANSTLNITNESTIQKSEKVYTFSVTKLLTSKIHATKERHRDVILVNSNQHAQSLPKSSSLSFTNLLIILLAVFIAICLLIVLRLAIYRHRKNRSLLRNKKNKSDLKLKLSNSDKDNTENDNKVDFNASSSEEK